MWNQWRYNHIPNIYIFLLFKIIYKFFSRLDDTLFLSTNLTVLHKLPCPTPSSRVAWLLLINNN